MSSKPIKANQNFEVICPEGAELYQQGGTASSPHLGDFIKDVPSGNFVLQIGDKRSFKDFKGGPRVKAMLVQHDGISGWIRYESLRPKQ